MAIIQMWLTPIIIMMAWGMPLALVRYFIFK